MKISKEEALKKIEELKKYVNEEEQKEKKKTVIYSTDGSVLYESGKEILKDAVVEAVGGEADLYGADLREADLREADLSGAELYSAKFYGKGGTTKIKKSQLNDFLAALGIILED